MQAQAARSVDELAPGLRADTTSVTAHVSIPIFQGGGEDAAVRAARESRSAANLNISETDRQVFETVHVAWDPYQAALGVAVLSSRQVSENAAALEGTRMESLVGGRNTIDILNADQELLQSRVGAVTAKYNTNVASYQLLAASGLFTAKALRLPVTLYDPKEHYETDSGALVWARRILTHRKGPSPSEQRLRSTAHSSN